MPTPQFLTVTQVAECLTPSVVYRLCESGKLRHHRFGAGRGAIRVGRADLNEFILGSQSDERDDYPQRQWDHRPAPLVFRHLNLRPKHSCGAVTKAGTPCTVPTRDERCRRHSTKGT